MGVEELEAFCSEQSLAQCSGCGINTLTWECWCLSFTFTLIPLCPENGRTLLIQFFSDWNWERTRLFSSYISPPHPQPQTLETATHVSQVLQRNRTRKRWDDRDRDEETEEKRQMEIEINREIERWDREIYRAKDRNRRRDRGGGREGGRLILRTRGYEPVWNLRASWELRQWLAEAKPLLPVEIWLCSEDLSADWMRATHFMEGIP